MSSRFLTMLKTQRSTWTWKTKPTSLKKGKEKKKRSDVYLQNFSLRLLYMKDSQGRPTMARSAEEEEECDNPSSTRPFKICSTNINLSRRHSTKRILPPNLPRRIRCASSQSARMVTFEPRKVPWHRKSDVGCAMKGVAPPEAAASLSCHRRRSDWNPPIALKDSAAPRLGVQAQTHVVGAGAEG